MRVLVAIYLAAIVIANVTAAAFGPAWTVVNAFLFIGLDLVIRDHLHDKWQSNPWKVLGLILVGGALSYLVNADTLPIALGSSVAFIAAMGVNALVYQLLIRKPFLVRSNASNVPAAVVDSILFPTIAFGAFLPWIIFGQIAAKILGGGMWSVVIDWFRRKKGEKVAIADN